MLLSKLQWFPTALIVSTALAGAFYCGYLCPFGLLQEIAVDIRKKLKLKPVVVTNWLDKLLKSLRYVIYICVSVLSIDLIMVLLKYDPRSNLYSILTGKDINGIMLISIVVFFFSLSLFIDRAFCRYLCIKGALYGILSKFRIVSIRRNKSSCVNCKRCDKACQMNICVSQVEHVDSMACINCFECIKSCPVKNTLNFRPCPKNVLGKRIAVLTTALLIGFIHYQHLANQKKVEMVDAVETIEDNAIYYKGTGEGYNGDLTVKVGIENDIITTIKVIDHQEDYEWYSKAKKSLS